MNRYRPLIKEARRLGGDATPDPDHRHPHLHVTRPDGTVVLQVLRGHTVRANRLVADMGTLRRLLGGMAASEMAAAETAVHGARRRRQRAPEPEPVVPHLTLLPDPWAPLAGVRERVELDCRCRLAGIDGAEARVERAGVMACERIRAWVAAVVGGVR